MLSWRAFPHVLSSLCNWSRMQQPEWSLMSQKKSSRYPSLHQVTLATNSRSHQIQGTDVCLQNHNWRCTNIPKLASSNLCALQKLAFCKWKTPCGAIPKEVPNHSHGPFHGLCPAGGMTSRSQFESLAIFKKHLKTHLFCQHLTNLY